MGAVNREPPVARKRRETGFDLHDRLTTQPAPSRREAASAPSPKLLDPWYAGSPRGPRDATRILTPLSFMPWNMWCPHIFPDRHPIADVYRELSGTTEFSNTEQGKVPPTTPFPWQSLEDIPKRLAELEPALGQSGSRRLLVNS